MERVKGGVFFWGMVFWVRICWKMRRVQEKPSLCEGLFCLIITTYAEKESIMNYNSITIIGRLGADPELRYTASGTAVCNLRIATNRTYMKDGEKQEVTTWFKCVIWGKPGENSGRYLVKGQVALVSGSMENRKWKDSEGNEKDSWEIHAYNVQFGEKPREKTNGAPSAGAWDTPGQPAEDGPDIPF